MLKFIGRRVYSVLSISTDGAKLQVDYNSSRSTFLRNIFSLIDGEVCFWRAARILRTFPSLREMEHARQSGPFAKLDKLEAHIVDKYTKPFWSCEVCKGDIEIHRIRPALNLGKT
jgi:hypothetical protein